MTRTAAQVRQEFIDFFCKKHGHVFVPSSPVVPHDDPTLLFANAGMNQFKPYFLGTQTPKHRRVANTQKCIRAGGKHNDLDDVGHDTYHHTFFEMLGNWSFGDYFKKEAIAWAWELLTEVWGLDATRLHATYFGGDEAEGLEPDVEARDLWRQILPPERVHPGSKKDNFWEMGDTGPCGPCSEIHVDLTPDKSGAKLVNAGDARVIEIWNLVFIQFNRGGDGKLTPLPARHVDTGMGFERVTAVLQGHNNNYATDVFVPIIQAIEKISGYEYAVAPQSQPGAPATEQSQRASVGMPPANRYARFIPGDMRNEACRVIADHIRTLTFALTDGAVPDNEGRGYVLRRILRRAVRYGWQYLNLHEPFLHKLVPTVVDVMGAAFPELRKSTEHVATLVREEEESFDRTLERGLELFSRATATAVAGAIAAARGWKFLATFGSSWEREDLSWDLAFQTDKGEEHVRLAKLSAESIASVGGSTAVISADDAFKLHDTFGFPIDLTQMMAAERGLRVDTAGYERLMEQARERARASGTNVDLLSQLLQIPEEHLSAATDDHAKYGSEPIEATYRYATGFIENGVDSWTTRGLIGLVFDRTCFYGEQGGQVGDQGFVEFDNTPRLTIKDTKRVGDTVIHLADPSPLSREKPLKLGQRARLIVDATRRQPTMKNHTATHIMNWALREVLGDHIQQKGSLVDPEKTRFDFSHPKPLTPAEIERVEQLANQRIKEKLTVHAQEVPQEQALKINGLRAVFGEKYPDNVRVVCCGVPVGDLLAKPDNPDWRRLPIEFCGGTHVANTGDIGHFVIISEEAVAKGVRRIVAITGPGAKITEEIGAGLVLDAEALKRGPAEAVAGGLSQLQASLAARPIPARHRPRVQALLGDLQQIVKQQHKAEAADAASVVKDKIAELLSVATKIGPTTVVVAEMPDVPIEQLKHGADTIKQKCGSAAILFGVRTGEKALLLAAMTDDLIKKGAKAGDLVKVVAPIVGGGGGGPPTMAQAGGKNPDKLPDALAAGMDWIGTKLADKS